MLKDIMLKFEKNDISKLFLVCEIYFWKHMFLHVGTKLYTCKMECRINEHYRKQELGYVAFSEMFEMVSY